MTPTLTTLIEQMTDAQRLLFRQAVVQQALDHAEQKLPSINQDDGERQALSVAQAWLAHPTEERAHAAGMFCAAEMIDGGVRYFDYTEYFLIPAMTASLVDPVEAATHALKSVSEEDRRLAILWQESTAQEILDGRFSVN